MNRISRHYDFKLMFDLTDLPSYDQMFMGGGI